MGSRVLQALVTAIAGIAAGLAFGATPATAAGCDINWDDETGSHLWQSPANWNPNRPPTPNDRVCVGPGFPELVSGANTSVGSLTIDSPLRVIGGTFLLGTLDRSDLRVPFTINGSGTLQVDGSAFISGAAELRLFDVATIVNDGSLALEDDNDVLAMGGTPHVENNGSISKSGATGLSTIGVNLDNSLGVVSAVNGTLEITGILLNHSPFLLAGGTYTAESTLRIPGADIRTLDAEVGVVGSGQIVDENGANALAKLRTVTGAGRLTVSTGAHVTTAGPLTNSGIVHVTGSGQTELTTTGDYTQTGGRTILESTDSRLRATGGKLDIQGGSLDGRGIVGPAVRNAGAVRPGSNARSEDNTGRLLVEGSYTQTAAGRLEVKLGGTTPVTGFDRLEVTGAATLDGALAVRQVDGFSPAAGDEFRFLDAATRNGTFASYTGSSVLDVGYDATGARLTVSSSQPRLAIDDVTVTEGNAGTVTAGFTVRLVDAAGNPVSSGDPITAQYATNDDTATAGLDYDAASGQISLAPGQTQKPVEVTVRGDNLHEAAETFSVDLASVQNAALGDGHGVGTITNDDPTPILRIQGASALEGHTGNTDFSFPVTLTHPSGKHIRVDFQTANGTATAPDDYTARVGQVELAPGQTQATVVVPVHGDVADEPNEHFDVTIATPDVTIGSATANGVILNDDQNQDSDRDGLLDRWEMRGIDTNNDGTPEVDLPRMGADPLRKDVFVELDQMPNHKLDQAALDMAVNAFKNAPVTGPVPGIGIRLHIDAGPNSVMNPTTGEKWGSLSRSADLTHDYVLGAISTAPPPKYDLKELDDVEKASMENVRRLAFHHALSIHQWGAADETSSGLAWSTNFVVSLGAWCTAGQHCSGSTEAQAGTFLHELGHTLGLDHGGGDGVNYKPNYPSVMNYAYQVTGLPRVSPAGQVFDYSRSGPVGPTAGWIAEINENRLTEIPGLIGAGGALNFKAIRLCDRQPTADDPATWTAQPAFLLNQNGIDWSCDGAINGGLLYVGNVNGDGEFGILKPYLDWDHLVYDGGPIGGGSGADGLPGPAEPTANEAPMEQLLSTRAAVTGDARPPRVTVKLRRRGQGRKRRTIVTVTATDNTALDRVTVRVGRRQLKKLARPGRRTRKLVLRFTAPRGKTVLRASAIDRASWNARTVTRRIR